MTKRRCIETEWYFFEWIHSKQCTNPDLEPKKKRKKKQNNNIADACECQRSFHLHKFSLIHENISNEKRKISRTSLCHHIQATKMIAASPLRKTWNCEKRENNSACKRFIELFYAVKMLRFIYLENFMEPSMNEILHICIRQDVVGSFVMSTVYAIYLYLYIADS